MNAREHKQRLRLAELLTEEEALWAAEVWVAGLDEAGAGPLAGAVVAGCVVLDPKQVDHLLGVDDSKKLSEAQREDCALRIQEHVRAWAVGEASVEEIDRINIREAGRLAMQRALNAVLAQTTVEHLLVDARSVPGTDLAQTELIKGDSRSLSIAAASILAKVTRDRQMKEAAERYPGYGFESHKGYGTAEHLAALRRLGPTPIHRATFAPVTELLRQGALFKG